MRLGQKRSRTGEDQEGHITFTDDNLKGVQVPHNDTLVVTLRIGEYDIERILVDQGSCTEILYYDSFQKLGLTQVDLVQSVTPLVGFNSDAIWSIGKEPSCSGRFDCFANRFSSNRCTILL